MGQTIILLSRPIIYVQFVLTYRQDSTRPGSAINLLGKSNLLLKSDRSMHDIC